LAEAEYVVAVYMYMRLIGYPAEKISILTTYNGQKFLIRDVIKLRCSKNPLIGNPHKVTFIHSFWIFLKSSQVFVYSDHLWHKRRGVYKIITKFS